MGYNEEKREKLEQRRLKAAKLFEKGVTLADIAHKLKVDPSNVSRWYAKWKKHGIAGLKSKGKPGPESKLTPTDINNIQKSLLKSPTEFGFQTEFWTLPLISELIKKLTGIKYHPGYLWWFMTRLGWTCKKPEIVSKNRDEKKVQYWIKKTWPRIKKKTKN